MNLCRQSYGLKPCYSDSHLYAMPSCLEVSFISTLSTNSELFGFHIISSSLSVATLGQVN